jgi:hypothetical protein
MKLEGSKDVYRKCRDCDDLINISRFENNAIYFQNRYVHIECFIKQKLKMKNNKLSREEILKEVLPQLIEDTSTKIGGLDLDAKNKAKEKLCHEALYNMIHDHYGIKYAPKSLYIKIANVINGKDKRVFQPIPVFHLYDMWEQKMSYLDRIAVRNSNKGVSINGINRVYYDLSIILSKYDSYLNWIQSQDDQRTLFEKRLADKMINEAIDRFNSVNTSKERKQKKENTDMNDLINEI